MIFAALAYLLLAAPVRAEITARMHGMQAAASVCLHIGPLTLRYDMRPVLTENGRIRLIAGCGQGEQKSGGGARIVRLLRPAFRVCACEAAVRVGLGDACATAIAAGSLRAAAAAALEALGAVHRTRLSVEPVFSERCFSLRARCIFSSCAGDIMIAAARAAHNGKKKGERAWISIPLKT